jgi:hypothetical protein
MSAAALALALSALPRQEFRAVEVTSANGYYAAEIRKASGQERVPDAVSRWRLSVHELPRAERDEPLWTCVVQHAAGERLHLLSDDGRTVAAVEPVYGESRPLFRAWREGEPLVELSAMRLSIDRSRLERDETRTWLDPGRPPRLDWIETPRGPVQFVELATSYGESSWVDLETGDVRRTRELPLELLVVPPASRAAKPGLRVPRTERYLATPEVFWGDVLEVAVTGAHPTPNWLFVGFELAFSPEKAELWLTPVSAPPPAGRPQLAVEQRFSATARIGGLAPGTYTLRLEGFDEEVQEPPVVVVRHARPLLALRRRGGFAGLDQLVRVHPNGAAVLEWRRPVRDPAQRTVVVRPAALRRLAELAELVPARDVRGGPVADAIDCELEIFLGPAPRVVRFPDPGATGPLADLARAMLEPFEQG